MALSVLPEADDTLRGRHRQLVEIYGCRVERRRIRSGGEPTEPRRLTDGTRRWSHPSWSPDGRLIAECHTPDKAEFEAWLKKSGWTVESITQIKTVAKAGDIWKV